LKGCVKELAEMRGAVNQLNKIVSASVRQSIWQLIAVIVTLLVAIAGGLAYQTSAIDKRIEQMERSSNTRFEIIEKRFEQSDKNFGDRFEQLEKRIEQSDKNMAARFEDLKQEVRAQRK
jgi:predicted PurR-regulated permease PerM